MISTGPLSHHGVSTLQSWEVTFLQEATALKVESQRFKCS